MTERGWTMVVVRGIGLWLVSVGLMNILQFTAGVVVLFLTKGFENFGSAYFSSSMSFYSARGIAGTVLGLYLLFGASWLIDRIAAAAASGCRACGYPVDKSNPNCPECGVPEPDEKSQP